VKFLVEIAGRSIQVEVLGPEVRVRDRSFPAALLRVPGTPLCQLVTDLGSRSYAMMRQRGAWVIQRGGVAWVAEVVDQRTHALRALKREGQGKDAPGMVRAPMPGMVLRVEVEVGQELVAGGGLVVLEAMKMENEIRSPGPGQVKAIFVEPGQAVEKGAPLVEIVSQG
jgi:pyruvate carboxylase subunit B